MLGHFIIYFLTCWNALGMHSLWPQSQSYKGYYEFIQAQTREKKVFQGEFQIVKIRKETIKTNFDDYNVFLKIYLGVAPRGEYFVYFFPNFISYSHGGTYFPKNKGPILSNLEWQLNDQQQLISLKAQVNWPFDGSIHNMKFSVQNTSSKGEELQSLRGVYQGKGDYEDFILELHTLKAPYDYLNLTSNPFLPYDIKGFIAQRIGDKDLVRFSIKKGKYDFLQGRLDFLIVNAEKSWPLHCELVGKSINCENGMQFEKKPLLRVLQKPSKLASFSSQTIQPFIPAQYQGFIHLLDSDAYIPLSWIPFGEDDLNLMANLIWPGNTKAPTIPIFFEPKKTYENIYRGHQFLCMIDTMTNSLITGEFYHMQWGHIGPFTVSKDPSVIDIQNTIPTVSMDTMLPHGAFKNNTSIMELYMWLDDDIQIQEGSYYFPLKLNGRYIDSQTNVALNIINAQFDLFNREINGELENGQIFWGHMVPNGMEIVMTNSPLKRATMLPWALRYWEKI